MPHSFVVDLIAHGYQTAACPLQPQRRVACGEGYSARHLIWMTPLHRSTKQGVRPMASKTNTCSTKSTTETTETTETKRSSKGTSVNRVILVGRLVATPELRTTASGIHVTTVRIATNDPEQPEFHDVVLWRQQADFATKYMTKGRLAYIEGRQQSRTWEALTRVNQGVDPSAVPPPDDACAAASRMRRTSRLAVPSAPRPYCSSSSVPTELCITWLRTAWKNPRAIRCQPSCSLCRAVV